MAIDPLNTSYMDARQMFLPGWAMIGLLHALTLLSAALVAAESEMMFVTSKCEISMVHVNTSGNTTYKVSKLFLDDLVNVDHADVHAERHLLFWKDTLSDLAVIYRIPFDKSSEPVHILSYGLFPNSNSFAVDWVHDKIFFVDSVARRIEVVNMDGSHRRVLLWNMRDDPRSIVVHPSRRFLIYTRWSDSGYIVRCNYDTTGEEIIVSETPMYPMSLTLDIQRDTLYWVDARPLGIFSSDLSGRGRRLFLHMYELVHPYSVAPAMDRLYFTDWGQAGVNSCLKQSCTQTNVVSSGGAFPMTVKLASTYNQPPDRSGPCHINNGGCSHICLPLPSGHSCFCPTGVSMKPGSNTTCMDGVSRFLAFFRRQEIRIVSFDEPTHPDYNLNVAGIIPSGVMDIDPLDMIMYWMDDTGVSQTIFSAAISLKGPATIKQAVHTRSPASSFAVDWLAKNVYWIDAGRRLIYVADLGGSTRLVIVHKHLDDPRLLVVDPIHGHLFWCSTMSSKQIERSNLDGSNRLVVVRENIEQVESLAVDFDQKRLYWSDRVLGRVYSTNLHGRDRLLVFDSVKGISSIGILGDMLFWVNTKSRSIVGANRTAANGQGSTPYETIVHNNFDMSYMITYDAASYRRQWTFNPCYRNSLGCSHMCFFVPPSAICRCPERFSLDSDGKTCILSNQSLFLLTADDVHHLPLDHGQRGTVMMRLDIGQASSFVYGWVHQTVFWTDVKTHSIRRALMNNTMTHTIVHLDLAYPVGLAIDWSRCTMFWADSQLGKIEVAYIDGSHRRRLWYKDLVQVTNLEVDPATGRVFWLDAGRWVVEQGNMDGTDRSILRKSNGLRLMSLDASTRSLLWVEQDSVMRLDLDSSRTSVLAPIMLKQGLFSAVNGLLFWSDESVPMLLSLEIFNVSVRKTYKVDLSNIIDIDISNNINSQSSEHCYNFVQSSRCSQLELSSHNGTSVCACETFSHLLDDEVTCAELPETLYFSASTRLYKMVISEDTIVEPAGLIHQDSSLTQLVQDVRSSALFLTATEDDSVLVLNRNKASSIFVSSVPGLPYGMDLDPYSSMLFLTYPMAGSIVLVETVDGTVLGPLVSDQKLTPMDIVLYPDKGYMFWVNQINNGISRGSTGGGYEIIKARYNDEGRMVFVPKFPWKPVLLTIDLARGNIVWFIKETATIHMVQWDGKVSISVEAPPAMTTLRYLGSSMYWSDGYSIYHTTDGVNVSLSRSKKLFSWPAPIHFLATSNLSRIHETNGCMEVSPPCGGVCFLMDDSRPFCDCPSSLKYDKKNHYCVRMKCSNNEVLCNDHSSCVSKRQVCDGNKDCADGSDEQHCKLSMDCRIGQVRCSGSEHCIDTTQVCNQVVDCPDGSDEKCTDTTRGMSCLPGEFACNSGKCIASKFKCDGHDNCGDSSDEHRALCSSMVLVTTPTASSSLLRNSKLGIAAVIVVLTVAVVLVVCLVYLCKRMPNGPPRCETRCPSTDATASLPTHDTPLMSLNGDRSLLTSPPVTSSTVLTSSEATLYHRLHGIDASSNISSIPPNPAPTPAACYSLHATDALSEDSALLAPYNTDQGSCIESVLSGQPSPNGTAAQLGGGAPSKRRSDRLSWNGSMKSGGIATRFSRSKLTARSSQANSMADRGQYPAARGRKRFDDNSGFVSTAPPPSIAESDGSVLFCGRDGMVQRPPGVPHVVFRSGAPAIDPVLMHAGCRENRVSVERSDGSISAMLCPPNSIYAAPSYRSSVTDLTDSSRPLFSHHCNTEITDSEVRSVFSDAASTSRGMGPPPTPLSYLSSESTRSDDAAYDDEILVDLHPPNR